MGLMAFADQRAVPRKFSRLTVLPLLSQGIVIAALLIPIMAVRWYWHDSAGMSAAKAAEITRQPDGAHAFDFYTGKWRLHNNRLLHPLRGSNEWVQFDGTAVAHKMWNGAANVDEFEADTPSGHVAGMTVRLYNADTREWKIYAAKGKDGSFSTPAGVGRFVNGRGEFYDHEKVDGKPVYVRILWQVRSEKRYHWEQAFSTDEGKSWVTNWIIDSTRMEGPTL